ncbi:hypothetical protein CaLGV028 [Clostera anastomosis granulovirus A]|uniref:Uncharacterized protein n=1 Tax=Clostera anastomosis granulovirus A TaxID=1986289 RepID=U5KAS2_9BBAC|nr:hypothetical protein CaLGV028 [Clostera anastomosis granulovirus Henan]AGQ20287.1 hypothetical protein CaLGV028 [Clostera anastomosis granulovirus Henan]
MRRRRTPGGVTMSHFRLTFVLPLAPSDIQRHHILVYVVNNVCFMWRGTRDALSVVRENSQPPTVVIEEFDCVWDMSCDLNRVVQLLCVTVVDPKLVNVAIDRERNRVVNFRYQFKEVFL